VSDVAVAFSIVTRADTDECSYSAPRTFCPLVFGFCPPVSFKERGARYALMMLSDEDKRNGVISASLGNHAQALCYHGKRLRIPVTVVMPTVAPIIKIEACRNFGASVIVRGDDMKESKHLALRLSKEKNVVYINGSVRRRPSAFRLSSNLRAVT